MAAVRLIIADSDKDYTEDLGIYIKAHHSSHFSITCFNNHASFLEYLLETNDNENIFLAGPGFYEALENRKTKDSVIFLSPVLNLDLERQKKIIFKYQNVEIIVNSLLSRLPSFLRAGKIIAVYSPIGGSGKTTVALGASILSSWEGKKVFYLNLESSSSSKVFLSGDSDQCLSHVLYYMKDSKDDLADKLERANCFDPFYRIHYYLPPQSILDLTEDMTSEIRALLNCLRNSGQYDYIFIDMESCLDRNNLAVLEEADEILVIVVHCPLSVEKVQSLVRQMKLLENGRNNFLLDKIKYIFNKDIPQVYQGTDSFTNSGISIYHKVPFVKDLLVSRGGGLWRLDMNSTFANSIHLLLKSIQRNDIK